MKRGLLLAPVLAISCAQLLSYDDYQAKTADIDSGIAPGDSSSEVATDSDVPTGPARPPERPTGDKKPSGTGKTLWLAVKHYHLGEQNLDNTYAPDAFRYWGFDLDHVCTSLEDAKANIGTCRRNADAPQDVLLDGDRCRDNNFGQHVVPLIHAYSADFEARLDEGILAGNNTWILRIDDLDPGADDPYAPAKLYRATSTKGKSVPKWDGSDVRSILADSLVDGVDLDKPVNDFVGGYVKGNVWVSGEPSKVALVTPVTGDLAIRMVLDGMIMTFEIDAAHTTGGRGMVGGGIPFASFEDFVRPVAAGAGFCPGSPLYDGLLKNVQRMPDLVAGAPNLQDTSKDCDALSIGIGFDLAPVQPVTEIVPPTPPTPTKCDDAGVPTDGG
ncbi:MAG: hypothetical protein ACXVEF_34725 [Polyangiales bacterium]